MDGGRYLLQKVLEAQNFEDKTRASDKIEPERNSTIKKWIDVVLNIKNKVINENRYSKMFFIQIQNQTYK